MKPGPSSESLFVDDDDDDDEPVLGGAAKLGDIMLAAVWIKFPPNKFLIGLPDC